MPSPREQYYQDLEENVSSMVEQIECGKKPSSNKGRNEGAKETSGSDSNEYSCPFAECGEAFTTKAKLDEHVNQHCPKIYTCLNCGAEFRTTRAARKHHEQNHEGDINIDITDC